jgi:alpha-mannosidase
MLVWARDGESPPMGQVAHCPYWAKRTSQFVVIRPYHEYLEEQLLQMEQVIDHQQNRAIAYGEGAQTCEHRDIDVLWWWQLSESEL